MLIKEFNWEVIQGKREVVYFWDLNDKRYFDCHVCDGVYNLGHRNSEVVAAVQEALEKYYLGQPPSDVHRALSFD